jgi:DNA-binding beta-propeller fold protein YncE
MTSPRDVKFGPDGNLYVADFTTHSVLRFNGQTGAFIDTFISPGVLSDPELLHFDVVPEPSLSILWSVSP